MNYRATHPGSICKLPSNPPWIYLWITEQPTLDLSVNYKRPTLDLPVNYLATHPGSICELPSSLAERKLTYSDGTPTSFTPKGFEILWYAACPRPHWLKTFTRCSMVGPPGVKSIQILNKCFPNSSYALSFKIEFHASWNRLRWVNQQKSLNISWFKRSFNNFLCLGWEASKSVCPENAIWKAVFEGKKIQLETCW